MTADTCVEARLLAIAADVFAIDPRELTLDRGNTDIRTWDSLGHVALVEAVEEAFHVSFPVEDVVAFERLRDIKLALDRLLAAR